LIILDTHAWIWWNAEPDKLSGPARQAIDEADEVGICPISCWELAMLVSKNRLKLDRAPLELIVATAIETVVPLVTRDRLIRDFGRVDVLW
jgi:PIN domain nuclease of toxin-antitoxin system